MQACARHWFLVLAAILLITPALACGETTPVPVSEPEPEATAAAEGSVPTPTPLSEVHDEPERSYHLGFTPFPHDLTEEAFLFPYEKAATDADIIAHHFDAGVPWREALAGLSYHENIRNDWQARRAHTPPGHQVYLAITPIRIERSGMAWYWGEEEDMPLPEPWNGYAFDHPDVKTAFVNHAINAIEFFEPDCLAVGIEVNLLLTEASEQWDAYLELHKHTYTELKARYPDLPVMASVFGLALIKGFRDEDDLAAQAQAFDDLMAYSDHYALSLYPYMGAYLTDYPERMWDDLFSLSNKPIAITETGFPAQDFSISSPPLTFESTPEKQDRYIARLLDEADAREFVLIINFVLRDYDALFVKIGGGDRDIVWRDTGFYDENGEPRPALETWRGRLARPYKRDE